MRLQKKGGASSAWRTVSASGQRHEGYLNLKCFIALPGLGTKFPRSVKEYLASNGIASVENHSERDLSEDRLLRTISDFDAVLASTERYSEKVLRKATKLRVIARVGVGHENIDLPAASRRGICVTWTPLPELAYAVAEHTFGLILSLSKRIPHMDREVRSGLWRPDEWSPRMLDLYSLTLGILGLGRIGSEVAKRARAFNMRVIYHDPVRRRDLERRLGVRYADFRKLLKQSDILTIHTPLSSETRGLIDRKAIGLMKGNALIINTSRGPVIDETALVDALSKDRLGGACLDVLSEEPPRRGHMLYKLGRKLPNLVITPHIDYGPETARRLIMTAAEDVVRVLTGKRPLYLLNSDVAQTGRR